MSKTKVTINVIGTGSFDVEQIIRYPQENWDRQSEKKRQQIAKEALISQIKKGRIELKINTIDYRELKYAKR